MRRPAVLQRWFWMGLLGFWRDDYSVVGHPPEGKPCWRWDRRHMATTWLWGWWWHDLVGRLRRGLPRPALRRAHASYSSVKPWPVLTSRVRWAMAMALVTAWVTR